MTFSSRLPADNSGILAPGDHFGRRRHCIGVTLLYYHQRVRLQRFFRQPGLNRFLDFFG
jgi:hypothetical protein